MILNNEIHKKIYLKSLNLDMDLIFIILIVFALAGWLLGKLIQSFIPKPKDSFESEQPSTFITHNHIQETHNHLHVDKDTLKELTDHKP